MKRWIAPLAAALAAGGGLYGALAAADRRLPEPADRWLNEWIAAGLKAEGGAENDEPGRTLIFYDARGLFKVAALERLPVRDYLIAQTRAQVVGLPDEAALREELPEGRHRDYKLKPKSGTIHLCRSGRWVLLVSTEPKAVPFFGKTRLPKQTVDAMFQAFEDVAR